MEQTKARPSDDLVRKLSELPTANISDAMGRVGGMSCQIRPMYRGAKLCGPAYTVQNYSKDNLMSHYALKHSLPGDVLVIDSRCGKHGSGWGELMSLAAKMKGLAGIVIEGSVRDISELEEIKFPVFAIGAQAEGTVKNTHGNVDCPIVCGGISVIPGDVMVGDENGIVVVPLMQAESVLASALAIRAKEEDIRTKVLAGESLYEMLGIGAFFDE